MLVHIAIIGLLFRKFLVKFCILNHIAYLCVVITAKGYRTMVYSVKKIDVCCVFPKVHTELSPVTIIVMRYRRITIRRYLFYAIAILKIQACFKYLRCALFLT